MPSLTSSLQDRVPPRVRDWWRRVEDRLQRRGRWPAWSGDPWLLTEEERDNPGTTLRPWSTGNAVTVLCHGRCYLSTLARSLAQTGPGDLVLIVGWRFDPDERMDDDGTTVSEALTAAARRGATVKGLIWRSHLSWIVGSLEQNRRLAVDATAAGAEMVLDQRIRPFGSLHQKFVVIRPLDLDDLDRVRARVAFVGGIDLARSRRDDSGHGGDPQAADLAEAYGETPAWHDLQLAIEGPAVADVEEVFRERWQDPWPATRLPWHTAPDVLHGLPQRPGPLPSPPPDPPASGSCRVQLLRNYPQRLPGYRFAPHGERSVARGYAKALQRAQRLVYIEDQYLWSQEVAHVFAQALRRSPRLQVVAVVPRFPEQEGRLHVPPSLLGKAESWRLIRAAGGDRVQQFNVENASGRPIYVHAKVCVIDDVWAAVGSSNLNRRSWTHDSELTVAVLDESRDDRVPADPAELGDGARRFARELRLQLMTEHLGRHADDHVDLLDPDSAVATVVSGAAALDDWYASGCSGPRPAGRLRRHVPEEGTPLRRRLTGPAYDVLFDPDGRPWRMRIADAF